jgi:predicted ester cyclase
MSTEQNKAIFRRFLQELDHHKQVDAVRELCAAGFVAYLPGSIDPVDREGFKGFIARFYTAFPDLRHTVEDQIAEGDMVVSRLTVQGTHLGDFLGIAPTGREITITDILIARMEKGKAVELWAQFDMPGLLRQLGAFPPAMQDQDSK